MNAVVLLAEDDPVSRTFLRDTLLSLGLDCDAVDDGLAAIERAAARRYDLLLLDLNLPGADGPQILAALRGDPQAASAGVPAIALTADDHPDTTRRLQAAGFDAVAHKPIACAQLAEGLRRVGLAIADQASVATAPASSTCATEAHDIDNLWDDQHALAAAGGNRDIVLALRTMMQAELPLQRATIAAALARGDASAASAELHRLRASCGFCGASALGASSAALQTDLARGASAELSARRFFNDLDRLTASA